MRWQNSIGAALIMESLRMSTAARDMTKRLEEVRGKTPPGFIRPQFQVEVCLESRHEMAVVHSWRQGDGSCCLEKKCLSGAHAVNQARPRAGRETGYRLRRAPVQT